MLSIQEKRIIHEIKLFDEAYPESSISYNGLQVSIHKPNLECIINLPNDWPFKPPYVLIKYMKHKWNLKISQDDWCSIMDLRTVYNMVLVSIENDFVDQMKILESMIPSAEMCFDHINNLINITYNGLQVEIPTKGSEVITVIEHDQNWPQNMIPCNNFNFPEIILQILGNQKTKIYPDEYISKLKRSLESKFDNVVYSRVQQTFIINSDNIGLIIIGINPDISYLPPNIIIFNKGMIVSNQFDFGNWSPDSDLGQIILDAKIM